MYLTNLVSWWELPTIERLLSNICLSFNYMLYPVLMLPLLLYYFLILLWFPISRELLLSNTNSGVSMLLCKCIRLSLECIYALLRGFYMSASIVFILILSVISWLLNGDLICLCFFIRMMWLSFFCFESHEIHYWKCILLPYLLDIAILCFAFLYTRIAKLLHSFYP